MIRWLSALVIGLLLAAPADAGSLRRKPRPSGKVLHLPFNATGAMIPDDAGTVAHVTWDGAENLVNRSDAYDIGWSKGNGVLVTPDVMAAPDGAMTADYAYKSTSASSGLLSQGVTLVAGATYTEAVYLKGSATSTQADIGINCSGWPTGSVATILSGPGSISIPSNTYARVTGLSTTEWTRAAFTAAVPAASCVVYIYPDTSASTTIGAGIYVGGAQVNAGKPIAYVATGASARASQITDTKGNAWSMAGTVPQVTGATASYFYPGGFSQNAKSGAGPFADANYYSLGSGADVADLTDLTVCVVFTPYSAPGSGTRFLVADGAYNVAGWYINQQVAASGMQIAFNGVGSWVAATSGAAPILGGPNVFCGGRSGSTAYAKLNLGTTTTGTIVSYVSGAAQQLLLGRSVSTSYAFDGAIHEVWISSSPWSEANVTKIQQGVFGMLGTKGEALTVTRAITATCDINGRQWTVPVNVPCIRPEGIQIEPGRNNLASYSDSINSWTGVYNTPTVTADDAACPLMPTGLRTMESVTCGASSCTTWGSNATFASTTGPFTVSAWIAAKTGTNPAGVQFDCGAGGNVVSCSCTRSDGAACTTTINTTQCYTSGMTVGTGTVRFAVTATCTTANTSFVGPKIAPGVSGTLCAGGAQAEVSGFASSYIPTTTAAVYRQLDLPSTTNPIDAGSAWCVDGTYTPENGRAWGQPAETALWSLGATSGANSARHMVTPTGVLDLRLYDGVPTLRQGYLSSGFTAGSTHRITGGSDLRQSWDGVWQSLTLAGAGTGVLAAQPATLYLGAQTAASNEFGGFIRDFKVYKNARCK